MYNVEKTLLHEDTSRASSLLRDITKLRSHWNSFMMSPHLHEVKRLYYAKTKNFSDKMLPPVRIEPRAFDPKASII